MSIGLRMGPGLRQTQSLRQTLKISMDLREPPIPPNALKGIEGMRVADEVLKRYGVAGILIGGLAKEVWRGTSDPAVYAAHKDVDVLVLSYDCDHHPGQWEDGIDWWITHSENSRPSNGGYISLVWQARFRPHRMAQPGLYICPQALLRKATCDESILFRSEDPNYPKMEMVGFDGVLGLKLFEHLPRSHLKYILHVANDCSTIHCDPL